MTITNNKKNFAFESVTPDGDVAFVQYRWLKGAMLIMQTYVPQPYRNAGIGSALMKYVMENAREQGLKIKPYCPYSRKWLANHTEYSYLLE